MFICEDDLNLTVKLIEDYLDEHLSSIGRLDFHPVRRILPMKKIEFQRIEPNYEFAIYDPEFEKYGGEFGVDLAEQLFQLSSEVCCTHMKRINEGEQDRFALGLAYMAEAVHRIISDELSQTEFLQYYLDYWSNALYSHESVAIRDKLLISGGKRRKLTSQILADTQKVVDQSYITYTKSIIKKIVNNTDKTQADLLFNYIHMMSNRLGIWPLEEAYLAALLLEKRKKMVNEEVRK
jgi:thiopeptide-type bacteriocin biosynthesis protein